MNHEARLALLEAAAPQLGAAFGIEALRVRRLPSISRAVFALEDASGRYVLRVHHAGESCIHLESLLIWLQALSGAGRLCVPRPLTTVQGPLLGEVNVAGLPDVQRCSLLSWLPGVSLTPEALAPGQARAMGELLARLHDFAAQWRPPPGFARPRLDAAGLFGEHSPYASDAGDALFSSELRGLMAAVAQRTQRLMQRLDAQPHARGLIHADFIAKNCLFTDAGACALDFDDCAWGYFLYDLAPAMLQFSALPGHTALAEALWAGYTARRPLPQAQRNDLETLVAARLVASCRWLAANQHVMQVRARTAQLLAQRAATLRNFLVTGRVRRRSAML